MTTQAGTTCGACGQQLPPHEAPEKLEAQPDYRDWLGDWDDAMRREIMERINAAALHKICDWERIGNYYFLWIRDADWANQATLHPFEAQYIGDGHWVASENPVGPGIRVRLTDGAITEVLED